VGFENLLKDNIKNEDLNKSRYVITSKGRPHVSKSKIDTYSNAIYLNLGESKTIIYSDRSDERYLATLNITYDILVSIFDVNTGKLFVYRTYKLDNAVKETIKKYIESMKKHKPNFEARIIGFQNNQDFYLPIRELLSIFMLSGIEVVEVDLFGNEIRNISIDIKLGSTYNLLTNDRAYRPGELENNMTLENFEAELKKK
jgi:hypothetical protein